MPRNERHAVYLVTDNAKGDAVAFRVGQPVSWGAAQARNERLFCRANGVGMPKRPVKVKHDGRTYTGRWFEVRTVDAHGRGLGSERHATALVTPYRAVRSAKVR